MDTSIQAMNRKEKQRFLRASISKEHMEDFCEYIADRRPNGTEVDNWALNELIEEVNRFQQMRGVPRRESVGARPPRSSTPVTRTSVSPPQRRSCEVTVEVLDNGYNTIRHLSTQSSSPSPRVSQLASSTVRLQVIVTLADVKENSFTLTLQPEGLQLIRRWTDLLWLRAKLQVEFPHCYIPPVRCKKSKEAFVQKFFDRLLNMKIAQKSEVLRLFLDEARYKSLKSDENVNVEAGMLARLEQNFADRTQRQIYRSNMAVYEAYFSKLIVNFQSGSDGSDLASILRDLEQLGGANAKYFSTLKHQALQLSQNFTQASTLIAQMARTFDAYMQQSEKTYKRVGLVTDPAVSDATLRIRRSMDEWSKIFAGNRDIVADQLANFFHYKKHEYRALAESLKLSLDTHTALRKKVGDLETRKRKLFEEKKLAKWKVEAAEIKEDFNEIAGDFARAERYILPRETAVAEVQREVGRYVVVHALFEYINYYMNSLYYFERNFHAFKEQLLASLEREAQVWREFSSIQIRLSAFDRDGVTIVGR